VSKRISDELAYWVPWSIMIAIGLLICWLMGRALASAQAVAQAEPETAVVVVYETVYEIIPARIGYIAYEKPPRFNAEEEQLFASVVMGECGSEPDEGIAAVAKCLLNAMDQSGLTVAEAITAYGYVAPPMEPSIRVMAICQAVMYHGLWAEFEGVYFYAPRWMPEGTSEWHERRTKVAEIGGHRFFR